MKPEKALDLVKDEAKSVELRKQQLEEALKRRSDAILQASKEGHTYQQIADAADLSIHTIQAELRIARRNQRG